MRTSCRFARTSGVSTAGLRMSPSSPPVQHTRTAPIPSAAYLATVADPFDASSSGCAWTDRRRRGGVESVIVRATLSGLVAIPDPQRPGRDPPDVTDLAVLGAPPAERRVLRDRPVELVGRQDRARVRDLHQAVGEVHDRPVVVALARDHLAV